MFLLISKGSYNDLYWFIIELALPVFFDKVLCFKQLFDANQLYNAPNRNLISNRYNSYTLLIIHSFMLQLIGEGYFF